MTTANVPYPGYPGDPYHPFRTLIDLNQPPGPGRSIESVDVISSFKDFLLQLAYEANCWIETYEDFEYIVLPEPKAISEMWEISLEEIDKLKNVTGSWVLGYGEGDCFCPDWVGLGHPELEEESTKGVMIFDDLIVIGVIQDYCMARTLTFITFVRK